MVGIFIAIAAVVVVVLAVFILFSANYIKAEPDRALILTGRKYKHAVGDGRIVTRGWRSIHGGAALRLPVLEKVNWMSLRNINLTDIKVYEAYSLEGVPVSIDVVANTKISSEAEMLGRAVERFLGVSIEKIEKVIKETIEGQLRDIIGTMTVEQLNRDRQTFVEKVITQASEELGKMGVIIDVLNIQKISDSNGYLEALGQKRTAEVKRDAAIGRAEAERDAMRQAETAIREGLVVKAEQERQTALANKERDVAKQQYFGETISAEATAVQKRPLADAQARQSVVKEEQRVFEEMEKARKAVESAKADANAELYRANMVVPADAEKQAAILRAEGQSEAIKQIATAEAYKIQVAGEAEGAATRAKILGEAEGTRELAEALNKYEESGKLKITLDTMRIVAEAGARTLDNVIPSNVIVFDGGGGQGQEGALSRALNTGPAALAQFLAMTKAATGIDFTKIAEQYKVGAGPDREVKNE